MTQNIRNFGIISHIDHGKSTLADRFLELTQTIDKEKMRPQFLDTMELEREKGITIKLQPVRMEYKNSAGKDYVLNMIDTPGHVDFSYEVSRSLAAIEGVVLLVDVLKGIQAQTLVNLDLAKKENLAIIPVINKIDLLEGEDGSLNQDRIDQVAQELANVLEIDKAQIFKISAKQGTNVDKILEAVVEIVPLPQLSPDAPLRALIFDFKYDSYQGVIAFVRVKEGKIKKGDELFLINSANAAKAKEVGWFKPDFQPQEELKSGEIGYVVLGIKEPGKVKIGDTVTHLLPQTKIEPLPGYKEPKPVVFVSFFPANSRNWPLLKDALLKLKLDDPALSFKPESKSSFGKGFLCGFLGLLHAEIIVERLRREFNLDLMTSAPSVCYNIIDNFGASQMVCSVMDWPDGSQIKKTQEQYCQVRIIVPIRFLGSAIKLIEENSPKIENLSVDKMLLTCQMPFREIMTNFYDRLKSATQGYGSMDYKLLDWRDADLAKIEVLIVGKIEESLSIIVPKDKIYEEGKALVEKLEKVFPAQLFAVPLQAKVGGKIIARRTKRAKRRDVIAPLYGGDYTRKRKLLEKQKKGKKKLQERAQIRIPQEVFWKMLRL